MKRLFALSLAFILAACGGLEKNMQNWGDQLNAKMTLGKPYAAVAAQTRAGDDINPLVSWRAPRVPAYGSEVGTEPLANGAVIHKHVARVNSSTTTVLSVARNDAARYVIYYFLVSPSGAIQDVATATYDADSTWSLGKASAMVSLDVATTSFQVKQLQEIDALVKTMSGQGIDAWRRMR